VFRGWADSETDATNEKYTSIDNTVINSEDEKVLYAVWKQEREVSLHYNANLPDIYANAVIPNVTAKNMPSTWYGKLDINTDTASVAISNQTPTLYGYDFVNWSDNADNGKKYIFGDRYNFDAEGSATLDANWKPKKSSIVFDANKTSVFGDSETKYYNFATQIDLDNAGKKPTNDGYWFDGWADSVEDAMNGKRSSLYNNCGGNTTTIDFEGEKTVYAIWTKVDTAGLEFAQNLPQIFTDGTIKNQTAKNMPDPQEVVFAQNDNTGYLMISSKTPTLLGHTFVAWIDENDNNKEYQPGDKYVFTQPGTVTLKAKWIEKEVNIVFDKNDGTSDTVNGSPLHYKFGDRIDFSGIADPARQNFHFLYWGDAKDSTSKTQLDGHIVDFEGDKTVYAIWKGEGVGEIIYDENKPSVLGASQEQQVVNNMPNPTSEIVKLDVHDQGNITISSATPTLYGYEFRGWALSTNTKQTYNGGDVYNFTKSETVVLKAIWEAKPVNIKFHQNSGSNTDKVIDELTNLKFGDEIPFGNIKQPNSNAGYTFDGWTDTKDGKNKSNLYNNNGSKSVVNFEGNRDLWALWSADEVKMTFYRNFEEDKDNNDLVEDSQAGPNGTIFASYGEAFKLSDVAHEDQYGYNFMGWADTQDNVNDYINIYNDTYAKSIQAGKTKEQANAEALKQANFKKTTICKKDTIDFTNDRDLYAIWLPKDISVTFMKNDGTVDEGNNPTQVGKLEYKFADKFNMIEDLKDHNIADPIRTGYTFEGWADSEDKAKEYVDVYNTIYKDTYDANIALGKSEEEATQEATEKATQEATKSKTDLYARDKINFAENRTVYAIWMAKDETVIFMKNDGTTNEDGSPVEVGRATWKYDSAFDFDGHDFSKDKQPTREGYTFAVWSDSKEKADEYTKLYVDKYKEEFTKVYEQAKLDGKDSEQAQQEATAAAQTSVDSFASSDATLNSNKSELYGKTKVDFDETKTVYAVWIPHDATVVFMLNDGTATNEEITRNTWKYNEGFDLSGYTTNTIKPNRKGYTFVAWADEATELDEKGKEVPANKRKKSSLYDIKNVNFEDKVSDSGATEKKVVYAIWKKNSSPSPSIPDEGVGGDTMKTVVIANGERYTDVLTASVLAHEKNAPILLSEFDKINATTMAEIARLKPDEIIISGGAQAVSENVVTQIKKELNSTKVTRIWGADRYQTAIEIGKQVRALTKNNDNAVLVVGTNFPDAMTMSTLASETKAPILLTQTESLNADTNKTLKDWKIKNLTIGGKEQAVSAEVENAVKNDVKVANVSRIGGADRYETAKLVGDKLRTLTGSKTQAILVDGTNFPDALTISSIASAEKMPILLTEEQTLNKITESAFKEWSINKVLIAGGYNAVAKEIEDQIQAYATTERLAGEDRYGTAGEISDRYTSMMWK
jgi:putative cell wall-binding protein